MNSSDQAKQVLQNYINVVARACPSKKEGADRNHCNQVHLIATSIFNLGHFNPNTGIDLEELRLDCTVNDKKRSKECLTLFHQVFSSPLGEMLESLATKYKK